MVNWDINWNNIRPVNGDVRNGFEEFICQLARKENIPNKLNFVRKGNPDAGLECFWELDNGDLIGWQAKYFTNSLSSNEWGQVEKSIKTALDNHSSLKKIIIAIPLDPSDRSKTKDENIETAFDKSKKKKENWKNLAKEKGMDVDFEFWWSSNLIERLQNLNYEGFRYFWFNETEFSDEWFNEHIENSLLNLGDKYTPNFKVGSKLIPFFNVIARNNYFKNYFVKNGKFEKFIIDLNDNISNLNYSVDEISKELKNKQNSEDLIRLKEEIIKNLKDNLIELINVIHNYPFNEMDDLNLENINEILEKITYKINQINNCVSKFIESDETIDPKNSQSFNRYHFQLENIIDKLKKFLIDNINLTNNPFLLITGEAGVGKSFLFGNVAEKRNNNNEYTIFLMGHQFSIERNIETTIINELGLQNKCNFDEFLDVLECKAQINKSRVLILIDAINEGKGLKVWNEQNNIGFINKISKRKWLSCAISIRDGYLDDLENNFKDKFTIKEHTGFQDNLFDAQKQFFNHYKIQIPNTPLLKPEFNNSLFLKLFCETLNNEDRNTIPDGMQGITKIINSYIDSLNEKLAKKLDFTKEIKEINLIKKILNIIINCKLENDEVDLNLERTLKLVNKTLNEYDIHKPEFLTYLIDEGILIKRKTADKKDNVDITFQRLNDYLTIYNLLSDVTDLKFEFSIKGKLYKFISKDPSPELIEMLFIYIPENYDIEFFDLIPDELINKYKYKFVNAFISSLKWRKCSSINENIFNYIEKYIFKNDNINNFLELLIILSPIENHILNADKTHEWLFNQELGDRDSFWIKFIYFNSPRYRYIDISEITHLEQVIEIGLSKDHSFYSNESIRLLSIMISWFLATTTRNLRDNATKSLINLLKDKIDILLELLKKFEGVNDPYIYERLYAVAYGCSLFTLDHDALQELAEYVYETIFNKEIVYEHILLRDYARNIIELALAKNIRLEIDVNKIQPPYQSNFPDIPDNDQIEEYKIKDDTKKKDDTRSPQNWILYSMAVEHEKEGKTIFGGDFGTVKFLAL
ncbi:MAG: hypothetical protein LBM96_08265 [Methanobrevibacter sp.]|jgi:hypothetical protein|nr:hypothetical protein [Candidatus Methanoflexus mossambicus]